MFVKLKKERSGDKTSNVGGNKNIKTVPHYIRLYEADSIKFTKYPGLNHSLDKELEMLNTMGGHGADVVFDDPLHTEDSPEWTERLETGCPCRIYEVPCHLTR